MRDKNCKSVYTSVSFAHDFQSLKKENIVSYGLTEYRSEGNKFGLNYKDKSLKIKWLLANLL